MFAADIVNDDTFNICTVIATVLFIIAAVMAILERAWIAALTAAGLAFFAFAWVVVS